MTLPPGQNRAAAEDQHSKALHQAAVDKDPSKLQALKLASHRAHACHSIWQIRYATRCKSCQSSLHACLQTGHTARLHCQCNSSYKRDNAVVLSMALLPPTREPPQAEPAPTPLRQEYSASGLNSAKQTNSARQAKSPQSSQSSTNILTQIKAPQHAPVALVVTLAGHSSAVIKPESSTPYAAATRPFDAEPWLDHFHPSR